MAFWKYKALHRVVNYSQTTRINEELKVSQSKAEQFQIHLITVGKC